MSQSKRATAVPRSPQGRAYSSRIKRIRAACQARGIAIHETEAGNFRLRGRGIDITTSDLSFINEDDLNPFTPT